MSNISTITNAGSLAPSLTLTAAKIINAFFSSVQTIAGKPSYNITSNAVVISIHYYMSPTAGKHNTMSLSASSINSLGLVLSKLFGRPVQLELVRLHYPHLNAHVLAQYISMNTKYNTFTRVIARLWASNIIAKPLASQLAPSNSVNEVGNLNVNQTLVPTYVTGIKVKLSGRLDNERSTPRQSVQQTQVGTFSGVQHIEMSSFTSKNKKGAFTIKVWLAQARLS